MCEPEGFHVGEKKIVLESVRAAVEKCPKHELQNRFESLNEINFERIHKLLVEMQLRDSGAARACKEKMKLVNELSFASGKDVMPNSLPPSNNSLLRVKNLHPESTKQLQNAPRLIDCARRWDTKLVSSANLVGEHQSKMDASPSFPKRIDEENENSNKNDSLHLFKLDCSAEESKESEMTPLLSNDSASCCDVVNKLKMRECSESSPMVQTSQDTITDVTHSQSKSKATHEEKGLTENLQDAANANILKMNSASMESPDDVTETLTESTLESIDSDPELRLLENEPKLWVKTVDKEVVSQLTKKQVKKQEHIYELIITEKHHCRMLKIMKKLFADGMSQELGLKETLIKSIFPCLDELITIHFSFLWRLRERQRMGKYIASIGDLLLEQFVGDNAQGLKDAYGLFCSRYQDAMSNYKDLLKTDLRFQTFIRSRSGHHLMEKKGIPECSLFVTYRMTKYPLMIGDIIKYSKDQPEETEALKKALQYLKEILVNINSQVAEKEKRQRLLEIYQKIDVKSFTMYKDHEFKNSDLLIDSRKLVFEGEAILSQQKGKQLMVVVVVMSDLIFFLQESNQKYYFLSPDNKAGAIPLSKLLVREKAGQDTRSIYLISGNQNEMFEFECTHPKHKKIWLDSIREAVEKCPDVELGSGIKNEANSESIPELLLGMQHQNEELARVNEKIKLIIELVAAPGADINPLSSPDYRSLSEGNNFDHEFTKELQITSLNETSLRLVGSASGWGTNLARSVSSVGEHQSEAYVTPSLPKRAETFGGFDNPNKDNTLHLSKQTNAKKKKDSKVSFLFTDPANSGDTLDNLKNGRHTSSSLTARTSRDNLSIVSAQSAESSVASQQQQTLSAHLVQCLNTALILSYHHLTQYEMFRAKVATGTSLDGRFSHFQKLEELRNIQEQISHERAQWTREREHQEKWISDKKEELKRLEETVREKQEDVNKQRKDLYRKLEALSSQGIILNICLAVLMPHSTHINTHDATSPGSDVTAHFQSPHTSPTAVAPNRTLPDSRSRNSTVSLPNLRQDSNSSICAHLVSAINQQKGAIPVTQQLPMKLTKLVTAGSGGTSNMSSSSGGSMSVSQDKELPIRGHLGCSSHVVPDIPLSTTVQQILPLQLSEGPAEPKVGSSYQHFALPSQHPFESQQGLPAHQCTGHVAAHLVQCLNAAFILSQHYLTQYEMFRAKVATGTSLDGCVSHSEKLEELRNIQEQISHERAQWTREREHQDKWVSDKKEELKRIQETLKGEQEEISQQREDFYRKLEALNSQGIVSSRYLSVLMPHSTRINAGDGTSLKNITASFRTPRTTSTIFMHHRIPKFKRHNSTMSLSGLKQNPSLPTLLISTVNEQEGDISAKQQLPMKLAKYNSPLPVQPGLCRRLSKRWFGSGYQRLASKPHGLLNPLEAPTYQQSREPLPSTEIVEVKAPQTHSNVELQNPVVSKVENNGHPRISLTADPDKENAPKQYIFSSKCG